MIVGVSKGRVAARRTRTITSTEGLTALARRPLVVSLTPDVPVTLAIAELNEHDARQWEARLNRAWMDCGCRVGEAAAMVAIGAYVAGAFAGLTPAVSSNWGHLAWGLAAAILGAAVGKIVGRARTLGRFRRAVLELRAFLAADSRQVASPLP